MQLLALRVLLVDGKSKSEKLLSCLTWTDSSSLSPVKPATELAVSVELLWAASLNQGCWTHGGNLLVILPLVFSLLPGYDFSEVADDRPYLTLHVSSWRCIVSHLRYLQLWNLGSSWRYTKFSVEKNFDIDSQAPQLLDWKCKTVLLKSYDPSMAKYLCYRDDQFCGIFTLFYRNMHVWIYIYFSNYMLHSAPRRKNMPRIIQINIKALT